MEEDNKNIDNWNELKKLWSEFLKLNKVVMSKQTKDSCLHLIVGVICMERGCFLGTEREKQDLRSHYLKADDSRTGKGLMAKFVLMILNKTIKKEDIIVTNKVTSEGLIGGWEGKGSQRREVRGNCDKLLVYRDEFQRDLTRKDSDEILGIIRLNCNNYGGADNLLKNSARSQEDFPAYYGRATFLCTLTPAKLNKKKSELLEDGTIQRFDVDFDEIDEMRSLEILDSMQIEDKDKGGREYRYSKQIEILDKICDVLNGIPRDKVVYINDDYYNGCVKNVKEKVKKYFEFDKRVGSVMHSLSVYELNLIMKYSARIAIIRGRNSITKEELEEAFDIIEIKISNLISKANLFEADADEKFKLVRDCKVVLGKEPHTLMEIYKMIDRKSVV